MKKIITKVSIITLVMVMMLSSGVFAADTFLEIEKGYFEGVEAKLTITNIKEELSDMVGSEIRLVQTGVISYSGDTYENPTTQVIDNAIVVTAPARIVAELSEPLDVSIEANKLTRRGNEFTYIDIEGLPVLNKEIESNAGIFATFKSGMAIELTEPGEYYVDIFVNINGDVIGSKAFVKVEEATTEEAIEEPVVAEDIHIELKTETTALPTNSKILVNGEDKSFEAYNIEGNNFFKLRDLAMVLSGTKKQIEVTWNDESQVINLISNTSYTRVGGEMALGDGVQKLGKLNTSKIFKDGKEVALLAYNIGGNNYFKLRDIASAFDIGVTWDGETSTVGIDTSTGYVAP